jgi:hypothetical protein
MSGTKTIGQGGNEWIAELPRREAFSLAIRVPKDDNCDWDWRLKGAVQKFDY